MGFNSGFKGLKRKSASPVRSVLILLNFVVFRLNTLCMLWPYLGYVQVKFFFGGGGLEIITFSWYWWYTGEGLVVVSASFKSLT